MELPPDGAHRPVRITIFTDFTEPAAYLTESVLRSEAGERPIDIEYRALEMHPSPAPLPNPRELAERAAAFTGLAEAEGLPLRAPGIVPRTRKAHEAALFAAEHERGAEMRAAIHRAYWSDGLDIGRIDVLVDIAAALRFDPTDLKIALDIDRHRDTITRDAEIARRLGVYAVPTLYVGAGPDARILLGAVSRQALETAIAGTADRD